MTTLKQFLEEEGYTLTGSIRCAVRRWLEQKRQTPRGWSVEQHQITGANALLDQLLEELKE